MHSLLRRQLRRHLGTTEIPEELAVLLEAVDEAYREFDSDRRMLERSLELSSRELLQANSDMRAIFSAFPDLFFRLDNEGVILDCKGGREEEFSLPPEKLLGKRIQDVPIKSVGRAFENAIQEVRENREPVSIEYTMWLDGEAAFYEARLVPVLEEQLLAIVRNITERKNAEDEIVRQREFLHQVIDLNPSFIFAKDRPGRFTLVNQAVADAYGTTVENLTGKTDADFNANRDEVARFRRDDLEVMNTKREKLIPLERITDASGRVRLLQTLKRPIIAADGRAEMVLGVSTDITELKQAEESLRRRSEQLRKKQVALQELALMSSPDLAAALDKITEVVARTLEVERVGVWLYGEDRTSIVLRHLCQSGRASEERGTSLTASQYPRYFKALSGSRTIAANDARQDPRTSEFTEGYLEPLGITSMLDVAIRVHGTVVGVVCHEHVGPRREWTLEEQDFAASIADFLSVSVEADKSRQLEHRLRHSQKMQAIGMLAGGIAHDFNNLLNVIMGYGDLAHKKLTPDHPASNHLVKVNSAASRAAELTRKLLTFSRRQVLKTEPTDVNGLLDEFTKLLDRIVGEDIEVIIQKSDEPVVVNADRVQLDQVLLNLCTNARQGMPKGGTLTLEVRRVELSHDMADEQGLGLSGPYVQLDVSDTGVGMSDEVLARLWEPFYTTKNSGTGLGLSMVYGIVEQHHGLITVESHLGRGSTFHVFLPVADAATASDSIDFETDHIAGRQGTVLVAEDEPMLRDLVAPSLDDLGYEVITAENGEQAISEFEARKDEIALAVLDVVMPKVSGPEAFKRMKTLKPDFKAIFASGYAPEGTHLSEVLEQEGVAFMPKPFRLELLAAKIREVLESDPPADANE